MTLRFDHRNVFFDLEFLGDIRDGAAGCRIYEIAATCGENKFQTFVDPYPGREIIPEPVQEACFKITRKFIDDHDVPRIRDALGEFITWLREIASRVTLISHACFRSDMLVLRHAVVATRIIWPRDVMFADSLNILRICAPHAGSYTLANIHEKVLGSLIKFPHSALYDATALRDIMNKFPMFDNFVCAYGLHQHPLSNLKHIGAKTELFLLRKGFDPTRLAETRYLLENLLPQQRESIFAACEQGCYGGLTPHDGIFKSDADDDAERDAAPATGAPVEPTRGRQHM